MARRDPLNIAHYWRDRRLEGLSLMRADFQTQQYAPHRHEGFVVAVTELGGSVIRSRGQVGEAKASVLLVFNPDEPHAGGMGASRRWLYRSLYLERDAIDLLAQSLGASSLPCFTRNEFPDSDLIDGFLALHRALQEGRDALRERELLVATFGALFARHGAGAKDATRRPQDRVRLATALDLMRARIAEPISLVELATELALTEYQVIQLFKRMTGFTPHSYLNQLRLDQARRRLARGSSIADAAAACGFYDQSALTSHFKRCYGVTPLQFAIAARN
ncbi:AraC family transcriptional regulator [Terrarubrum flagellatum]|uniref:AraC family transcriptional regulator n=1 Tax=Terrirubrum flagellatum TaxID=2895980 RepID=UPI00314552D6